METDNEFLTATLITNSGVLPVWQTLYEVLLLLASFHIWKLRSEKLRKFLKLAEPVSGRAGV